MKKEIVRIESVKECNSCERKIKRGEKAILIGSTGIHFCNQFCLAKRVKSLIKVVS